MKSAFPHLLFALPVNHYMRGRNKCLILFHYLPVCKIIHWCTTILQKGSIISYFLASFINSWMKHIWWISVYYSYYSYRWLNCPIFGKWKKTMQAGFWFNCSSLWQLSVMTRCSRLFLFFFPQTWSQWFYQEAVVFSRNFFFSNHNVSIHCGLVTVSRRFQL